MEDSTLSKALERAKAYQASQVSQSPKGLYLAAHEIKEDLDRVLRMAGRCNEWNFSAVRLRDEGIDLSALQKLVELAPALGALRRQLAAIAESNPLSIEIEAIDNWQDPSKQEWVCLWSLSDSGVCWLLDEQDPTTLTQISLEQVTRESLYVFPVGINPNNWQG